jgi:sugar O-acyltransferase (sialic acid O-acetyltransferase NeuD family)
MRIALIGAGGHAKVVADAIVASGHDQIFGIFDDSSSLRGGRLMGHMVLATTAEVLRAGADMVLVAIGDNAARRRIFEQLKENGARFATVRHPSAVFASGALLGEGSIALAHSYVGVDTRIGSNCILNTACIVDHDCIVGAHTHLAPGVTVAGGVRFGEGVFAGTGASITPGIKIGDGAVIGAGAVVTCDVGEGSTVVGVPARPL